MNSAISTRETGDAVALYGIVGCGTCFACLRGRDNECRVMPPGGIGLSRDGGMAAYVRVPATRLLPIYDLDVIQAAPLTPGVGPTGIPMETGLVIPFWGTRAELAEVIALGRAGSITAHVELFPLSRAQDAYDRLRSGTLRGRAVVTPGGRIRNDQEQDSAMASARARPRAAARGNNT